MRKENLSNNPSERQISTADQVIKFQTDGKPRSVRIHSINQIFSDIEAYNKQFSPSSVIAKGLFAAFSVGDDLGESLEKVNTTQQVSAESLSAVHNQTLNSLGLSLEPVKGHMTFMAMGGEARNSQMMINIVNRNYFLSFLNALQPLQITDTGLRPNLESLSDLLAQQLLSHYDLNKPQDEALELLGGLGRIVEEYQRLGMTEAVETLEIYLSHARQGDLREFIIIDNKRLLAEPGNWGPADWHKDAGPDYLESHWNAALDVLTQAKKNPNAKNLYEQLKANLLKCIPLTRQGLETRAYGEKDKAKSREILKDMHIRLERIASS